MTARRGSWWGLAAHLAPHRLSLGVAMATGLGASAVGLALPLLARRLVDDLTAGRPTAAVVLALVLVAGAGAVLGAAAAYLLERSAENVVLDVRRALVAHLARLRVEVLDRREPGDLTARVTADSNLLRDVVTVSLAGGTTGALMLVGVVVLMGSVDAVLLGVAVLTIAGAGLLIAALTRQIHRATTVAQEAVGASAAALERMFGAFRTMKAHGAEHREQARLHAALATLWRANVRAGGWSAVATGMVELAVQAALLVVLAVGGARVASGAIGMGTLVAFLMYVFMLIPPVSQVVQAVIRYQVGAAGADRIAQVFALPVEDGPVADGPVADGPVADGRPAPPAGSGPASVAFDDVVFRYGPGSPPVHRGVSFDVPARGLTAVVGVSGAGKTTLFSLLERFYEADAGRVLVDGRDVRDWPTAQLRAAIGYVEQEGTGLSGTVRDNLRYGAPHADEATLRATLALVRLGDTVDRLPAGLDTPVGHRGSRLSGGERQRLAIARALLRRPRLLLLDEVTSQLDAGNEAALRDTIADVARHTTVLVIAHRLSTVVTADRIVVLDAGRVRAVGRHAELLRADGGYAELAATQLIYG